MAKQSLTATTSYVNDTIDAALQPIYARLSALEPTPSSLPAPIPAPLPATQPDPEVVYQNFKSAVVDIVDAELAARDEVLTENLKNSLRPAIPKFDIATNKEVDKKIEKVKQQFTNVNTSYSSLKTTVDNLSAKATSLETALSTAQDNLKAERAAREDLAQHTVPTWFIACVLFISYIVEFVICLQLNSLSTAVANLKSFLGL
jgi:hypothetical protein